MLKKLEMPKSNQKKIAEYCKKIKIEFLCTPFDDNSLTYLVNTIRVKKLKIPSGEVTNGPLLLKYARSKCDIILSTGMASIGEIEKALMVLSFGLLNSKKYPNEKDLSDAYYSIKGRNALKRKVSYTSLLN